MVALATPLLIRLTGVGWLRVVAVPLSTILFATAFTLAGNGPLLRPLIAGLGAAQSVVAGQPVEVRPAPARQSLKTVAPFGFDAGFNPAMGPEGPGAGIGLRGLEPRGLPGSGTGFLATSERRVLFVGARTRGSRVHRVRGAF